MLPLFSRDLLVVTQEATTLGGADYPKLVWVLDNRLESNPVASARCRCRTPTTSSTAPAATGRTTSTRTVPGPLSLQSDTLVYATFFNGGIRVFDTTNPFQPEEVAHFVPQIPEGASANGINDVHVDENGIVYLVDRLQGGLYILELNI